MMCFNAIFVYCMLCATFVYSFSDNTRKNYYSDGIGFPEVEENENLKNKDNRQPVYAPSICPSNELYYPGDQKDDWICDCRPAYLYHPNSDLCWPAYQQGPCKNGEYLTLPKSSDSVIPLCEKNPCSDKYVQYKGRCERIGTSSGCAHMYPTPAVISVIAQTLKVDCEKISMELDSRFGDDDAGPTYDPCPVGSKRKVKGLCQA